MNSVSPSSAVLVDAPPSSVPRFAARATASFLLLVLLGVLSKGVGFVREMVLAARFGASGPMDAFLVAQTLPAAAQRVFDELLGASLLPLFAGWCVAAGEAVAWARLHRLVRSILLWSSLLVLALLVLSGKLVRLLAPGLAASDSAMAVRALAILLPSIACGIAGSIFAALLNYHRRYVAAAIFALAGNGLALVCILLLAGKIGVYSAAVGISAGALLLFLQWFLLPAAGRATRPEKSSAARAEFWRLAAPLAAGIALFNFIPLVERFLSSFLPTGGIALLNYAFKVDWLAYLVLVVPITTIAFPRLADAGAARDTQRFLGALLLALKGALLVLLPAMIFLGVAGNAVIALLYQRGNFTAAHSAEAAAILRVYLLGLPGAAWTLILFYALYALRQPAGRVAAGIAGLCVALALGWFAVRQWGAAGIAATHAVNFTALAALLGIYGARSLGRTWWRPLAGFTLRAACSAGVAFFAGRELLRHFLGAGSTPAERLALELASGSAACGLFVVLCWVLRVEESRFLAEEMIRTVTRGLRMGREA